MGNSFDVSSPVTRASIAAQYAPRPKVRESGGRDKTLRRLWVCQAGWEERADPGQDTPYCWLPRAVESGDGAGKTGWSSRCGGRYLVMGLGMGND